MTLALALRDVEKNCIKEAEQTHAHVSHYLEQKKKPFPYTSDLFLTSFLLVETHSEINGGTPYIEAPNSFYDCTFRPYVYVYVSVYV